MNITPESPSGLSLNRRLQFPMHIVAPALLATALLLVLAWSGIVALSQVPRVQVDRVIPVALSEVGPEPGGSTQASQRSVPTVQASGWIEPEPYAVAAAALADGVVEEIFVLEGQSVSRGQVVARLVSVDAELDLFAAEADLELAESSVLMAEAEYSAAAANWEHPIAHERAISVAEAELAEFEATLAQLPASIAEANAVLRSKRQEAERLSKAAAAGSASDIELIVAESAAEAQSARVDALEQRQAILHAQVMRAQAELRAASRTLDLRVDDRLGLESARANLQSAQSKRVRAELGVRIARLRYDRMQIEAPMDGLVLRRLKSPGDKIMRGMDDPNSAHILLIYNPEKLQVRADVPLADATHVSIGQSAQIFCEVLPDQVFDGIVSRITNEADLQRNTLQVKVTILNPSPILKPEMLSRVRFLGSSEGRSTDTEATRDQPQYEVPESALRDGGRVFVVRNRKGLRGRVHSLPVASVSSENQQRGYLTVRGPLLPTDLVVTESGEFEDGQLVEIQQMTPHARGRS